MRLALPITALFLMTAPAVLLVGCFGDTGTVQDNLSEYSDMGAAADAGRVESK